MAFEYLLLETRGRVGLVTLNRPAKLNALCEGLMDELTAAPDKLEADDDIGCIVLTGSAKAFAAGADIDNMKAQSYMDAYKGNFISRNWERIKTCRKPVIAALEGYAFGGGCELAMMCDFIIAADSAVFCQPEVTIGIPPGAGGTQRLPRAVGKAKAMDMCLTGRRMDAREAEAAGLVARVVRSTGRQAVRGSDWRGREDRFLFAAGRHDDQGVRQSRLRELAQRRATVRAARAARILRARRSEGRHGGLRREAPGAFHASLASRKQVLRARSRGILHRSKL